LEIRHFLRLEKSIGEKNSINILHFRVIRELWVNVEKDGEFHSLTRIESLLLEAETLDFIKILTCLERNHIVC